MITSIVAIGTNNELGKDKDLLWHLPDDFKRFKKLTTGHYIIMGRKTLESLPKPLPNRTHIVITRNKDYKSDFAIVAHNIEEALKLVESDPQPYIIGGGEIYALAMPYTTKIELTRVHASFEADAYFPGFLKENWQLIFEEYHPKDKKHKFDFTYETWVRKQ